MLYGSCHAAMVSLGYSTGLGFGHTGKQLSFVYDIADLYKAETTIPAAFETVQHHDKSSKEIRLRCRKYFSNTHILSRIAQDIAWILQSNCDDNNENAVQAGALWDGEGSIRDGGLNYAGREEEK